MRILNISAQKPDSTGSGVYLAELVRCQRAAGHEAAVVCGIDVADEPALPEGTALYPVRFNTPALPFPVCGMSDEMPYEATRYRDLTPPMVQAFRSAFGEAIARAVAAFRPDAVVCHHLYLVTALAREAICGIPVVAVCHGTCLRQMASHGLERAFIVEGVRALDAVFALHAAQAEEIVRVFGCDPARVQVLGTGYNAQVFTAPAPALRLSCDAGCPSAAPQGAKVLYVGKIWEQKGVGCLLEALDLVSCDPPLQVRLVGGHNDEEEFRRYRERAARSRHAVAFPGKVGLDELVAFYRGADVFVLPSFFEGLPLVVIEALACGCRVVVTDLPGIRPWLADNVPDAPIVYVEPPRMRTVDAPVPEDLPAFEERLAAALEEALALEPVDVDLSDVAWEGVERRLESRIVEAGERLSSKEESR